PKKFLLIELFEMGASLMVSPSITQILTKHPDAEIHVLTTDSCVGSWLTLNQVESNRIHVISGGSLVHFGFSILRNIWKLRQVKFEVILDFGLLTRVTSILSGILSAKHRAGFHRMALEGLYRGTFFDLKCSFNQNRHISANFLALTDLALNPDSPAEFPSPKIAVDRSLLKLPEYRPKLRASELTEKFFPDFNLTHHKLIVVSPDVGPTLSVRNYPIHSLVRLLDMMSSQYPNFYFAIVGTSNDQKTQLAVLEKVANKERFVGLCGKTSFTDLLDILAIAEFAISNDNGVAHFAALTRTRSLALFSTDSPNVYGPLGECAIVYSYFHCSPCIMAYNHKRSLCSNNRCLQVISPEFVFDIFQKFEKGIIKGGTVNGTIPYINF
ncbi:MAG: hypothetical protein NT027_02235, partial [Proteobacteria bacterium]|nr:hypothetical protein [Pseudomonadota bacterium]